MGGGQQKGGLPTLNAASKHLPPDRTEGQPGCAVPTEPGSRYSPVHQPATLNVPRGWPHPPTPACASCFSQGWTGGVGPGRQEWGRRVGEYGLGHQLGVTSLRIHHCLWVCLPVRLLGERTEGRLLPSDEGGHLVSGSLAVTHDLKPQADPPCVLTCRMASVMGPGSQGC